MSKESFLLYKSFYEPTKNLSLEEKGELYDALFLFQIEGIEPKTTSKIYPFFLFFKNQFRLDGVKYEIKRKANEANGKKGGRPKNPKKPNNPKNPVGFQEPKKGDNENDNVNDNGNEKVNENENENLKIYKELCDLLHEVLEIKMNRKINAVGWVKEIRKLVEIDLKIRNYPVQDVKGAINAISDHYGERFFPVVQSASSFRAKFTNIENFLKLNSQPPARSDYDIEKDKLIRAIDGIEAEEWHHGEF